MGTALDERLVTDIIQSSKCARDQAISTILDYQTRHELSSRQVSTSTTVDSMEGVDRPTAT